MKSKSLIPGPVRRGLRALQNERLINWSKTCLTAICHDEPIPLAALLALRRIAQPANALVPELSTVKRMGSALRDPFLAEQLANVELGEWTLSVASLNFVEIEVNRLEPRAVLEFGAGVSTVCLAHYMKKVHGNSDRVFVHTVEQNPQFAEKAVQQLKSLGLNKYVHVLHAPVRQQLIEGKQTRCYDLSASFAQTVPKAIQFDFLVIDGPVSEPGAPIPGDPGTRFGTLPLVRSWVKPGSSFLLDDGLRDTELGVAKEWSKLSYLQVDGVRLVGRGLVSGKFR